MIREEKADAGPGKGTKAFLYLLGALHWILFLNLGYFGLTDYDWDHESFYCSILADALAEGRVPLFISRELHGTTRFMAIPDIPLSPQVLLLGILPAGWFVVFHTLLLYSLGFWGCATLRRLHDLSTVSFVALLLFFNMTGFFTSHLAVGHATWLGFLLLPWFFVCVLEWAHRGPSVPLTVATALSVFAIGLQGSFHVSLWCLMFVGLMSLRSLKWMRYAGGVTAAWLVFSAVRFVPGFMTFGAATQVFDSGYPTLADLLAGLVSLRGHAYPIFDAVSRRLGWWEYDMYVGWIGLAFLLYFGLWLRFGAEEYLDEVRFGALDIPVLGMVLLALDGIWRIFAAVPVIGVERVSSRFLIMPVLALALAGCIRLDRWLKWHSGRAWAAWTARAGVLGLAGFLGAHSWKWRLAEVAGTMVGEAYETAAPKLTVRQGDAYAAGVAVGAAVTIVSLFVAILYLTRDPRKGVKI